MQRPITVNASQDDKKLSIKLSCTAFRVSCNNCNSDSQQYCIN